ncbi:hypothetical protein DFH06DRAFT_1142892 [Mycena polygramma]|nr:hypothetical protein DFH06DRAFT_1142892 [Mycena polygramma]
MHHSQPKRKSANAQQQENIDKDVGKKMLFRRIGLRTPRRRQSTSAKNTTSFLDIFFQGGAHMVNHHEKTNPYNAFKAEKAAERREAGDTPLKGKTLHDEYKDEYEALTAAEKKALVKRYDEVKAAIPTIRRDTPQARIRDVSNTVRNIQMLFHGLSYRVGVEGFFCIVRNTVDFHMAPQWYFTSKELERYMPLAVRRKWDTGETGTRLEAFAVAGCDTMNLLRTTKEKVAHLKGEVQDQDNRENEHPHGLSESIVLRYGVQLVGWMCERFVNPSELSSSLSFLIPLRDGECKWVKLTSEERKARKAQWKANVAAAKIDVQTRAIGSDSLPLKDDEATNSLKGRTDYTFVTPRIILPKLDPRRDRWSRCHGVFEDADGVGLRRVGVCRRANTDEWQAAAASSRDQMASVDQPRVGHGYGLGYKLIDPDPYPENPNPNPRVYGSITGLGSRLPDMIRASASEIRCPAPLKTYPDATRGFRVRQIINPRPIPCRPDPETRRVDPNPRPTLLKPVLSVAAAQAQKNSSCNS